MHQTPVGLDVFAIPGLKDAYYIPNFVTEHEEGYLIRKASRILASP